MEIHSRPLVSTPKSKQALAPSCRASHLQPSLCVEQAKSETSPQGPLKSSLGFPSPRSQEHSKVPKRGGRRPPRPSPRAPHPHLSRSSLPRPPRTPHSTGEPGRPHRGRADPEPPAPRSQAARPAERSRPLRRGPATAGGGDLGRLGGARRGSPALHLLVAILASARAAAALGLGPARPCVGPQRVRRPPPRAPIAALRLGAAATSCARRSHSSAGAGRRARGRGDTRGRTRGGGVGPAAQRRAPWPTDSGRGRGREGRPAGPALTLPGRRGVPGPSLDPVSAPWSPSGVRGGTGPNLDPLSPQKFFGVFLGQTWTPVGSLESSWGAPSLSNRGVPGPSLEFSPLESS